MSNVGPTATAGHFIALPQGTRLGEFEIRRVIGAGGFGIVYLAFDHGLEREVAIKEYMPSSLASRTATLDVSLTSPSNEETFKLGLRSFVNEAKLLARFDHRSLIKVHRFWEARGTAYMVMPLLRGRTLREVRRHMEHPPDEAWLRGVLDPVLGALDVLHRENVFHRDIAPDNILICDDGVPMLLDFGAARHVIQGRSQTLTAILKPSYAPIEQYGESSSLRQGAWTDLYALGATLHFLITDSPPLPATVRTVSDDIAPLAALPRPGISERFLEIVDWMLATRPLDRPQSVADLRDVLAGRSAVPVRSKSDPSAVPWQRTEMVQPPAAPAAPTDGGPALMAPPSAAAHQSAPGLANLNQREPLPIPLPLEPSAGSGRAASPARHEPTLRADPPRPADSGQLPAKDAVQPLDFVASRPMPAPLAPPAQSAAGRVASRSVMPYALGGGAVLIGAAMWWMMRTPSADSPAPTPSAAAAAASAVLPVPSASATSAPSAAATPLVEASAPTPTPGVAVGAAAGAARAPVPLPAPAVAQPGIKQAAPAPAPLVANPPAPAPAPRVAAPAADSGALRPQPQAAPPQRAPLPTTGAGPARVEPTLPPPLTPPADAGGRTGEQVPAPAPAGQAGAARDPHEACGRRMLIALHLCLVRECAKPAYADHPECVQVRAIEERARNRNTTQ